MISSPNNHLFSQQLEAIRQRLAAIRDRLLAHFNLAPTVQSEINEEFQTAIGVLENAQTAIEQAEMSPEIEQLRASVREKDVLLREIHHRVKNNLQVVASLLDLQAMRTEDSTVQAILRSNQSRISLISLVYEYISQTRNTTRISLGEYVQNLTPILIRTYEIDPDQVRFHTEFTGEIELSSNQVVSIGLILNELVSNAVRHGLSGEPGTIIVSLQIIDSEITLMVRDTGKGFPSNFDPTEARSLGFQLVNSLVQQINGVLIVEYKPETTITIRFRATDSAES